MTVILPHDCSFERYDASADRWACRCGESMDRLGTRYDAKGQVLPNRQFLPDPGVRSGRERMVC